MLSFEYVEWVCEVGCCVCVCARTHAVRAFVFTGVHAHEFACKRPEKDAFLNLPPIYFLEKASVTEPEAMPWSSQGLPVSSPSAGV